MFFILKFPYLHLIKGLNIAFSFVTKVFYKKKKRIFNCSLCYI